MRWQQWEYYRKKKQIKQKITNALVERQRRRRRWWLLFGGQGCWASIGICFLLASVVNGFGLTAIGGAAASSSTTEFLQRCNVIFRIVHRRTLVFLQSKSKGMMIRNQVNLRTPLATGAHKIRQRLHFSMHWTGLRVNKRHIVECAWNKTVNWKAAIELINDCFEVVHYYCTWERQLHFVLSSIYSFLLFHIWFVYTYSIIIISNNLIWFAVNQSVEVYC